MRGARALLRVRAEAPMTLHDLSESLEPLRVWFNATRGSTRVVAINSPT